MTSTILAASLSLVILSNVNGCNDKKETKTDSVTSASAEKTEEKKQETANTKTKTTPPAKQDTVKANSTHTTNTSNQKKAAADDNYRLVVQFYSKGEGTDYKTREKYDAWLASYKPAVKVEQTPWGREGEVDYCIKLNELDKTKQDEFVAKTKQVLSVSQLVNIYENHACSRKR